MSRLLVAALLLLAACGDGSVAPTVASTFAPAPSDTTDSAPATTSSPDTTAAPTDAIPESLVDFIDGIEEALVGTAYEGAALEDPDVFLATGALFCERLDAGAEVDDLLTEYIEQLGGVSVEEASDDDLVLAGSVLGVAVATLCPQHQATVSG